LKARDYIIAKQTSWAANNGITLVGSKGSNGAKNYTPDWRTEPFPYLITQNLLHHALTYQ